MRNATAVRDIGVCCGVVIAALYVVGAVSHGQLRHFVQTLPLWVPVALAVRRSPWVTWSAMPLLLFWLLIMALVWTFLLGWSRIVTGHYSPTEVGMTIVIGIACIAGLWRSGAVRTNARWGVGMVVFSVMAAAELVAFRISILPGIGDR